MAKPQGTREQHEMRTGGILTDQHGREYQVEIDRDSMAPCGPILPHGGWRQPIPTPSQYLKPDPKRFGKLFVDYPSWKRDLILAKNAYVTKMRHVAEKTYGSAFAQALQNPPGELIDKMGAGPLPVELVLAMENGKSPWALGLRRADKSFYPEPKWLTPELKAQWQAATHTIWHAFGGMQGNLPEAGRDGFGEFDDDATDDTAPAAAATAPFVFEMDEPETLDVVTGVTPVTPVTPQMGRIPNATRAPTRIRPTAGSAS